MDVDVVSTSEGLAGLRDEWEQLEERDTRAPYYITHRFVTAWWEAHGTQDEVDLHVVCARQNGKLVGVAPLTLRREQRKRREVRALRWASHGDFLSFLVDPAESAATVCKRLVAALTDEPSWDLIALGNVPADTALAHHLLKSEQHESFAFHVENPYVDLTRFDDFEAYAAEHLPSKVRKYRNKLFRERDVIFRVVRGNEDGLLDRMAELHRLEKDYLVKQKSRTERYSLYEDESREQQIRTIFERTEDPVTFLYETPDGTLVGYRTCFLHRGTLLSWNSAYHPEYDDYRIGKVLQLDIMQHLFETRLAERFDFGAGRYPWKFEWTDQFSVSYRLRLELAPREGSEQAGVSTSPTVRESPSAELREDSTTAGSPGEPSSGEGLAARVRGKARRAARKVAAKAEKRRGPVIWYVPHPDDETIFMGGSIAAQDRRNILVVLTQGGASKALDLVSAKLGEPLTSEGFMAARVREFGAARKALGVAKKDVVRHDLPDGSIDEGDVRRIVTEMAEQHPSAQHRTLSYLDPHRDHAAAGRALRSAFEDGIVKDAVFHLPVPLVDESWGEAVELSAEAVQAKKRALRAYKRWNPENGRFAVGWHSVKKLIRYQLAGPHERVHGPGYEPPASG